jgi:hypothetical protein
MRKLPTLLALTGVLTLVLTTVARAAPPQHFPIERIDDTFTIEDECAFAVIAHVEGAIRNTRFFDRTGTEIRGLTIYPRFRVTFSNPDTGKSITTASPAVEHVTINPDGSATVAVTGLQGHVIVGGGPPLAADVGRVVFFFTGPDDEEPDVLFQAGQFNFGPFPQLCDVLADP